MTDTGEIHGTECLIDCRADGEFLDMEYIWRNNIPTWKLSTLILVNNIDGFLNKNGPIMEIADLILHYKGHSE